MNTGRSRLVFNLCPRSGRFRISLSKGVDWHFLCQSQWVPCCKIIILFDSLIRSLIYSKFLCREIIKIDLNLLHEVTHIWLHKFKAEMQFKLEILTLWDNLKSFSIICLCIEHTGYIVFFCFFSFQQWESLYYSFEWNRS